MKTSKSILRARLRLFCGLQGFRLGGSLAFPIFAAAIALFALVIDAQAGEHPEAKSATRSESATEGVQDVPADAIRLGHLLAPKAFRASVERVLPSLVTIETYGGVITRERRGKIRGISKPGDGPTTGLIISPDGYVVTSTFNFLRQPPVITIVRQDGMRHVGKLLGRDDTRKLCVLKMEGAEDLPVPELIDPGEVRVGQWGISVGVGYGDDEPLISAGIVSAKNRISGRAIQTDANISPANYGGPLVDVLGRVIGICVPLNPRSQATGSGVEWYDSGIGFAVPLAGNENLLEDLKAGKVLKTGVLGVRIAPATDEGKGARIVKVQEGSGAAEAGLQPKDEILAVDGEEVFDVAGLQVMIKRHVAGDRVSLVIRRGDDELNVEATLHAPSPKKPQNKLQKAPKKQKVPETES